ncbi:MAG: hypothetical protein H6835_04140 [Planctomycetes bacterium]|nr:hypothetical protein [Planctomycetota bacterium]
MRTHRLSVLCLLLPLGACLSSRPAAVVRWFDATPVASGEGAGLPVARCTAAPQLGQPMLWRTGAHEFAFDELHRWLVAPADAVAAALGEPTAPGAAGLALHVVAFGGDLTAAPIATLTVQAAHAGRERTFAVTAPLADASAEALAAGMAQALAELRDALGAWSAAPQAP